MLSNLFAPSHNLVGFVARFPRLLSHSRLPHHWYRQLFAELARRGRPFPWCVQPSPQVAENKQLLPQQRRQVGKRPAEGRLQLQVLQDQYGNQCRPDLGLHGVRAGAQERLHFQCLFQRLEQLIHILPINIVLLK
jgi:hypothetical protein